MRFDTRWGKNWSGSRIGGSQVECEEKREGNRKRERKERKM